MIKNIVFDMGRVLLDYDAVRVCWQYTDSSEDVELMSRELFFAEEWVLLDRGNHHGGRGIKTRAEETAGRENEGDGPIMSGPLA